MVSGVLSPSGAGRILVVDRDAQVRRALRERLEQGGHEVLEGQDRATALARFAEAPDLVLLDADLLGAGGLEVMAEMRKVDPDALFIMMTAFPTIDLAVQAMHHGAHDYITKPLHLDADVLRVERALETTRLRREMRTLREAESLPYRFERMIGDSPAMRESRALLQRVAESPASTVLITGETGTGKDLAAKCIHYNSGRATGPFMNISCTALTETLIESELFGHESGSFTDARRQRKGLLELADKGTVFLDEVGDMSPGLQSKVLRFLEEKTLKRVGGAVDIAPDVRIIAATNRDLKEGLRAGKFREDLYYRLMVLPVHLPPLRERVGDVELLMRHYVDVYNREFGKRVEGIAAEALAAIEGYDWPGNVRELRNAVERAMLLTTDRQLVPPDLPIPGRSDVSRFRLPAGGIDFGELEKDFVRQALARAGGNQTHAATLLGMNRDQMRYRIEKFGLVADGPRASRPPAASKEEED